MVCWYGDNAFVTLWILKIEGRKTILSIILLFDPQNLCRKLHRCQSVVKWPVEDELLNCLLGKVLFLNSVLCVWNVCILIKDLVNRSSLRSKLNIPLLLKLNVINKWNDCKHKVQQRSAFPSTSCYIMYINIRNCK